jgi:type IV pilus assembly protein PilY1
MKNNKSYQLALTATLISALFSIAHFSRAAPATSTDLSLRQEPLTAAVSTPANVILMMDDSASMNAGFLPTPTNIDFTGYGFSGSKLVQNNTGGTSELDFAYFRDYNAFFNPQWYNPAIIYKPWNDNGKPALTNFPNADIGVKDAAGVVVNPTQNDMRFKMVGSTRDPVSTTRTDLFTKDATRGGYTCLTTVVQPVCTAYSPSVTTTVPDPASETGVSTVVTTPGTCLSTANQSVCTAYNTLPGLTPAKYLRFEGSSAADLKDNSKYRLVEIDRNQPATVSYPTPVDPSTGLQVSRTDCANPKNCTFTEEAQNYANWYLYYRTRLFSAIAVTSQVLSEIDSNIRIGYGRLSYFADGPDPWPPASGGPTPTSIYKPPAILPALDGQPNPGHIVRGVRPFVAGDPARQEVFDWLFGLAGVGGTPLREALDSVGKYFKRTDVQGPWANNPGVGDTAGSSQLACRKNFSIFATDGTWTDSPNHPRIANLYPALSAGTPAQSDSANGSIIAGAGNQNGRNYQYLLTQELALSNVGATASQTLADVAHHYWSNDLRPDLPNVLRPEPFAGAAGVNYPQDFYNPATWQSLTNYFVGYGLTTAISKQSALTAMRNNTSVAWPAVTLADTQDSNKTSDTLRAALASRGDFYSAQDPTQLADSLRKAFANVGKTRGAASALAVSSSVISQATDLVFEASFDSTDWTGQLRALNARDLVSGSSVEAWTAKLPSDLTTRKLFTTTGVNSAINLTWSNLSAAQQTAFGSEDVFKYFTGDQSNELPTGIYRKRSGNIGSIVGAGPVYSGSTTYGHNYKTGAAGSSYPAYLDWKKNTRTKAVFAGSNNGYLHSFDAATGEELFAFTPRSTLAFLPDLASPTYVHRFLVDGLITEGDAYYGGAWHTMVLGSSGSGPKSLFALDVTNPNSFNASAVKWEVTQADEPDMGHIMGGGMIASTKTGKWVAIVGNGYGSQNDDAGLLVFDLETGALLKKLMVPASTVLPKPKNGMGPATAIYDNQRNVLALYAGDKLGNLWKFDVSDGDPANWKFGVTSGTVPIPLFTASDAAGNPQPITTSPRVLQHPLGGLYVTFGTGKAFELNDESNTQGQGIYAIRDQGSNAAYTKSQLKQGVLNDVAGDLRSITGLSGVGGIDWSVHKGWYVDLPVGGTAERIIASPKLQAGMAIYSSFNPENSDPCEVGGKSFVYSFDLATNFTREVFKDKAPNIVASRTFDGLIGGTTSLYAPPAVSQPVVNTITASQLKNGIANTRYNLQGGALKDGGPSSYCAQAGNSITNQTLTIPNACAGTQPLRVWRDLK